jgi:hypothetical protein
MTEGDMNWKDEYKALRDEMLNLFTRVLFVFGGSVAAFVPLSLKAIEADDPLKAGLILLSAGAVLVAAVLLTMNFYQNIYSIGSYICVYLEQKAKDNEPGWHLRSRYMRIFLPNEPLGSPLRWFEQINEPLTLALSYAVMIILLFSVLIYRLFTCHVAALFLVYFAVFAVLVVAGTLLWYSRMSFPKGSQTWIQRWKNYKKNRPKISVDDLVPEASTLCRSRPNETPSVSQK